MSFSSRLLHRVSRALAARSTALMLVASTACATAVFACGGISDPTKQGETVATVSGSLTGTTVPAGARVALVWRTASSSTETGGYALGDDVPVVGGKFSISLAVPASAYFSELDGSTSFNSGSVDVPPSAGGSDPSSGSSTSGSAGTSSGSGGTSSSGGSTSSSSGGGAKQVTPKDMAGGSIVTQPLSAAVAGFVVYVDTNGNGKLDLSGQWAASTDTILGGASDLVLTYLKDGGALDYEKLRDGSGILPTAGFNLAWTEKERWLPLNEVELKLTANAQLPYPVCSTSGYYAGSGSGSSSGGSGTVDPVATTKPSPPPELDAGGSSSSSSGSSGTATDAGSPSAYPDPSDPNLKCSADGTSFSYSYPSTPCVPDPTPAPTGLCTGGIVYDTVGCATGGGYGASLPSDGMIPEGWPCTVVKPSKDGGAEDGGSADGG